MLFYWHGAFCKEHYADDRLDNSGILKIMRPEKQVLQGCLASLTVNKADTFTSRRGILVLFIQITLLLSSDGLRALKTDLAAHKLARSGLIMLFGLSFLFAGGRSLLTSTS